MVTDEKARQIAKEILHEGARGPLVVKYVRELLDDRDERVTREAQLRVGLRDVYKQLRAVLDKIGEQGKRLAEPPPATPAPTGGRPDTARDGERRARHALTAEGLEPGGER
jgi:hypothetical protein